MKMSSPDPTLTSGMETLIGQIRRAVREEADPGRVAERVASHLERVLGDPDLLAQEHCREKREAYCQNILHVEEDGSFSVVALVWRAGQETPVHDHVSWCVTGVHAGREHETRYEMERDPGTGEDHLREVGDCVNHPGTVAALCPPGDLHRVGNEGPETAISVHIYGADIAELGSSIRRTYDLPIVPAEASS